MRTRTVREGSVGLLLLLGLSLFLGLILWVRNITLGRRSYTAVIEFPRVNGLQEGAAVRYRGVTVGNITDITPMSNGVEVRAEISPADLIIPRDVRVEANQSGLVSQVGIDITPEEELPAGVEVAGPLAQNCDRDLIICNGSRLQGVIGISTDELIRFSTRFADVYSNPEIYNNLNTAVRNTSVAAAEAAQLTRELSSLSRTTQKQLNNISAEVTQLSNTTTKTAAQFGTTAEEINDLVANLNSLVTSNRSSLVSTLNNLNQTSEQLRTTVNTLSPTISRVNQGELIQNLETLSANAAKASTNLLDISETLNDPTNALVLQQTLDSARVTFQNAQKISSDLDELTGDPAFRNNLRELVNGLSSLVSSTQQLQQQVQVAEKLDSLSNATKSLKNETQISGSNNQALIDKLKNANQNLDSNKSHKSE